jgi:alpha-glucosidase (family GH31 glycosyl hydrolase)
MVVIVDPHLKRTSNYPVYAEAQERGLFVKKSDGGEFEGWCWSGSSAWVDFFNPGSWTWWTKLFSLVDDPSAGWRWKDSTDTMFIWNDMNEVRSYERVFGCPSSSIALELAISLQRSRNYDGEGQHPLRRLGTSGRTQCQWHALCEFRFCRGQCPSV